MGGWWMQGRAGGVGKWGQTVGVWRGGAEDRGWRARREWEEGRVQGGSVEGAECRGLRNGLRSP